MLDDRFARNPTPNIYYIYRNCLNKMPNINSKSMPKDNYSS